jgi:hypothetical protein
MLPELKGGYLSGEAENPPDTSANFMEHDLEERNDSEVAKSY